MLPERRNQIMELFQSARRLPLLDRAPFLKRACSGDEHLLAEVESLLLAPETVDTLLVPSAVQPFALSEGAVVGGRYRILRQLGRGGMGEVYEAWDALLKERVALKTLRSDMARDEGTRRQFQREVQLSRRVTHPNVCRIFEVGVHEFGGSDLPPLGFYSMELLEGETLQARARRQRLSRSEAFPIAVQLAEGLHAAHTVGVVHTDFKSGNVILVKTASRERAVITDFGLARLDPTARMAADMTMTARRADEFAGTVAYMSPEQMHGGIITASSDIYSFGIVLFEMATGRLPFEKERVLQPALQRATGEVRPVRSLVPDIDPRWEAAIERCLQKEPQRRFASAADLANWFRDRPWWNPQLRTRREWIRASLVVGIPIAAGSGLWVWATRPYKPQPEAVKWYEAGVVALHSMTYHAARKAFEKAIEADPRFALAHASLARAYDEMDYSERAKDSMLRAMTLAQEWRLSARDQQRLRAYQFMVSREFSRAGPLLQLLEEKADGKERAAAAVECGWLAEKQEDTDGAAAGYERAVKLDPQYAAAKLRLGFIIQRRGQEENLKRASQAFLEAEDLYRASSDQEGVTEALLQRARLLNRRSRSAEAIPVIQRAIQLARTVGNRYQEILLLLQEGVAARNMEGFDRARALTNQAINMAVEERMDTLATSGLIDLGNASLASGDLKSAEPLFLRALDLAQRGKFRRNEARAQLSLGSLCEQGGRFEEAKKHIDSSLPFYRNAGYRRELYQARILLASVHERLGEYEQGAAISREALAGTAVLQDRVSETRARQRLGRNLRGLGALPEALIEFREVARLLGPGINGAIERLHCARLSWRLGRPDDAEQLIEEVRLLLKKEPRQYVLAELHAARAEIEYGLGRLEDAAALTRQEAAARGARANAGREGSLIQALGLIRSKQSIEGARLGEGRVSKLEQAHLAGEAAAARLALGEAWMAAGNRARARQLALGALAFYVPKPMYESLWRAHAVAAWASEDAGVAEEHRAKARAALAELRKRWPAGTVDVYLRRPDLRPLKAAAGI